MKKLALSFLLLLLMVTPAISSERGKPHPSVWRDKTSDPTVNDDLCNGYRQGDFWINTTDGKSWELITDTCGSADWNQADSLGGTNTDGVTTYGTDETSLSGASNMWIVIDLGGTSTTVVSDSAGGATVYLGVQIVSSGGNVGSVAFIDSTTDAVLGSTLIKRSGSSLYILDPTTGETVFQPVSSGGKSGTSQVQISLNLPALTSLPDNPVTGKEYRFAVASVDPSSVGGTTNYRAIHSGGKYVTTWDDDGDLLVAGIETPPLTLSEMDDTSSPIVLTANEMKNKILTNRGQTGVTLVYTLPAISGCSGWNFTYIIEAVGGVSIDPNGTDQVMLNSSNLAAGQAIVNDAPTVGEILVCIGTGTSVYCESEYSDWAGDDQ